MTKNVFNRTWRFIIRMDVVVVLIVLVLLLAALGSCFPQQPPNLNTDPDRITLWETNALVRYGGLTNILTAIGAFRFFRSPLLILSLVLLATSAQCALSTDGRHYGDDPVGGCLGALLGAGLFIPVLGIPQTCTAIALVGLVGLLVLVK